MNLKVNNTFNCGNLSERLSRSLFTVTIGLVQAYITRRFSFSPVSLDRAASVFMETAYSFPAIMIC